jgi:hypothetical protein
MKKQKKKIVRKKSGIPAHKILLNMHEISLFVFEKEICVEVIQQARISFWSVGILSHSFCTRIVKSFYLLVAKGSSIFEVVVVSVE